MLWDVIAAGTGMGGGMLGYSLARSGRRVLFVEKGRSTLPGTPGTIRAAMPELAEPTGLPFRGGLLRRTWPGPDAATDEIEDISGRFPKRFVPFIGSGTGGSSALYGMVCERFFAQDFTPRQNFRDPGDSTVPEAWPITYDQMRPWYSAGRETARGARRSPIPCGPEAAEVGLPPAPPFSTRQPTAGQLSGGPRVASLSPADGLSSTPTGCATCQTYCCRSRAKTTPPATACCPRLPSTAHSCWPSVGWCAWRPTAPGSSR